MTLNTGDITYNAIAYSDFTINNFSYNDNTCKTQYR
jgi:hypothetical protein